MDSGAIRIACVHRRQSRNIPYSNHRTQMGSFSFNHRKFLYIHKNQNADLQKIGSKNLY